MMPRQDSRPVNLSLWHFRFPANALLSISHRITGVLLVASLMLWLISLNLILLQPEQFSTYQAWLNNASGKLFLSLFWLALAFHWLAGLRHLLIEFAISLKLKTWLRSEQAVWFTLGLWIAIGGFSLIRIWL
ncbi:succinate dehydrogenase, cytochrome b556 subunit [Thiomicrospira microaerophila]|uniref:succinate dehydrogenase, cytochrome b556 subunit n=1 Tax=Thiomicrospira microaerophila TaxID=406020 RepID=UPI00200C4528|nr:succinate dehydrogenase, cytochrome b556 subunit [Thiomicrospira microaerophila]UQB41409.1 succinate dehydrogenase, cytochrome b556 subunit [Thiomicrospira microaerophila]